MLTLTLARLRTADGHDLTAYVTATARLVDRPADVLLFAEQFLTGRDAATAADLQTHFTAPLAAVAAEFAAGHDAETCLRNAGELSALLLKRAEAAGFGCGLTFVGPVHVTLDSETLRADRQKRDARRRQLDDADHAAQLSSKLPEAGHAARLSVSDQAALLPSLLASLPRTRIVLTAGPNVLSIEPDGEMKIHPMPMAVGPLRSVRVLGDGHYGVGGTGGVAVVATEFGAQDVYTCGSALGRGFNAVASLKSADQIVATHGEFGLAVWTAAEPATPRVFPAPAARLLTPIGDRLLFACAGVMSVYDGHTTESVGDDGAMIVAIAAYAGRVIVVRQDGTLQSLAADTWRPIGTSKVYGTVYAAAALDVGGLRGVLIAGSRGGIDCVAPDATPLGRFDGDELRMVALAGGRPVGVTHDRTRVLIWDDAMPTTINILARTGHHVTDIVVDRAT